MIGFVLFCHTVDPVLQVWMVEERVMYAFNTAESRWAGNEFPLENTDILPLFLV